MPTDWRERLSVRSLNTSDRIERAEACPAEAVRPGYRPTPPAHQVYRCQPASRVIAAYWHAAATQTKAWNTSW